MYDKVCGRFVGCDRDIVHDRYTEERLDVGIVGLGFKRIPEKDDHIDTALCRLRSYLKVSAKRAGKISLDLKSGGFTDESRGRTRSAEREFCKNVLVLYCPIYDIVLLMIVRDEGNRLFCVYRLCLFAESTSELCR